MRIVNFSSITTWFDFPSQILYGNVHWIGACLRGQPRPPSQGGGAAKFLGPPSNSVEVLEVCISIHSWLPDKLGQKVKVTRSHEAAENNACGVPCLRCNRRSTCRWFSSVWTSPVNWWICAAVLARWWICAVVLTCELMDLCRGTREVVDLCRGTHLWTDGPVPRYSRGGGGARRQERRQLWPTRSTTPRHSEQREEGKPRTLHLALPYQRNSTAVRKWKPLWDRAQLKII